MALRDLFYDKTTKKKKIVGEGLIFLRKHKTQKYFSM